MNDVRPSSPPGWLPDPVGRHEYRYFNGQTWTADVADGGQRFVDPLGVLPTPAGSAPVGHAGSRVGGPFQHSGATPPGNGMATAALVCGIGGMLIAWIPFVVVLGIVLGVLGVTLGYQGVKRSSLNGAGRGRATAAIVTGGVALALSAVGIWLSILTISEIADFTSPGLHRSAIAECEVNEGIVTTSGTVTNLSATIQDYTIFTTILLETNDASREAEEFTIPITLDGVEADQTAEWQAIETTRLAYDTCVTSIDVYGPFPFGIEIAKP